MSGEAERHRIVIVGGGAAGLQLATKLGDRYGRRKQAEVTLVDRSRTHIWKPLLHEVAAGSMDVGHHAVDYLHHAHAHHFRYRIGEMVGLDRERRVVRLAASHDAEGREVTPERDIPYDTLVIAVGSASNDFGTPGVKEHAIALDTPDQAQRFHRRLINAMIRAHAQDAPVRAGQLHVAVIGAGATGTELVAELHRTTRQVAATGLDRIDPDKDLKLTLIEAADRILPAVPERLSRDVMALLAGIGVEVRTGARVTEVRADGVQLADGSFIASELVVWAAGVRAPEVLRDLGGLETTRNNQLVVLPSLQTTRDENVFALGDCAYLIDPATQRPIPPRAQAAHQQASHLLRQMPNRLAGRPLAPFRYRDFGSLVSLGEYTTVGNLMGFIRGRNVFIAGLFARLMYQSLYKMHQKALHGTWKVSLDTAARALTRHTVPRVKLH
ncbi:FAD-dependent pyridine nucleotide-disulphide oxidoreductase [Methylobacterium sp. 4-46]|uniref:NAD(P)/FAD-dependent oxidoreductase n=1 Tax=unclassified Methylobacterium TaxID=2615210 RepID=UPI000152E79B|nr:MULTISPECIES: NAD(P)/FAD-dependent oxidoreductase [Methylobacterium]ACA18880.1 FAD-dependent pyridine nucleotide-disulphide oxidoreductase [Methylobacterium sp. 4-46]WFT78105.1 NAD(P)/FAD-dependent oxidoreductase [Methylobacterium nodulans]